VGLHVVRALLRHRGFRSEAVAWYCFANAVIFLWTGGCHQQVEEIFYSRHSFMQPLEQRYPHQSFEQEVQACRLYLDCSCLPMLIGTPPSQLEFLGNHMEKGQPISLGQDDQWYLYTMDRPMPLSQPDCTLEVQIPATGHLSLLLVAYSTWERVFVWQLMMHNLSPNAMKIFYKVCCGCPRMGHRQD
jgi:hypothetical protein